jgi:hypothetical protein
VKKNRNPNGVEAISAWEKRNGRIRVAVGKFLRMLTHGFVTESRWDSGWPARGTASRISNRCDFFLIKFLVGANSKKESNATPQ